MTQAEYTALMGDNPSNWKGANLPVDQVSWFGAVSYCQRLTDRERSAGRITEQQMYRLPTEAEWEYASRAGAGGARYGELDLIAWSSNNSGGKTHLVRQKKANNWGLYDMIGNLWEWCADWYGDYPIALTGNPTGPSIGPGRVLRGGNFSNEAGGARSAVRSVNIEGNYNAGTGFRVALSSIR